LTQKAGAARGLDVFFSRFLREKFTQMTLSWIKQMQFPWGMPPIALARGLALSLLKDMQIE
jgi:hypothetical protein